MAIKIAGKIEDSFFDSTKITKKELQKIAKEAAKSAITVKRSFSQDIDQIAPMFDKIGRVAKASFKTIAVAGAGAAATITTALVPVISVGSGFESAFAGVKKTVDATDEELKEMENELRSMAKTAPISAAELSAIAEAAGQLGIKTEYITTFTKTMADLSTATNLTSEDAATQFARFANITGMAQTDFEKLGSAIVALGNNLATTESEISDMAMRLAGAGTQIGLSEADIMGFAGALSSVGIEAEAGGSAFSKLMVNLQLAVETGKHGLKDYAKVAGMTGKEFQKAFQADSADAILRFITGLNDTKRSGKSAIAILDSLGISEVRMRDALLRASGAGELFGESIQIANREWEKNTALTKEAEQRYSTFESKMNIIGNKTKDIGISIYQDIREPLLALTDAGGYALDALGAKIEGSDFLTEIANSIAKNIPTAMRKIKEFGNTIQDISEPIIKLGSWILEHGAIFESILIGVGTAFVAFKIVDKVKELSIGISMLKKTLMGLSPTATIVMGVVTAIGAIAGIVSAVKKTKEELKRQNLEEHFGKISLSLEEIEEVASNIVYNDNLGKVRESIKSLNELGQINQNIQKNVADLNKLNWKVSIGMQLTAEEQEQYQSTISEYTNSVQDFINEHHYAANLALEVLAGEKFSNNLSEKLNLFYLNKNQELQDLGTKLNQTITDAFQDGLLDMDEIKEITELQQQMARIQAAVAGSQFEGELSLLSLQYDEVDVDSFKNLISKVNEKVQAASADYDKAYITSYSSVKTLYDNGDMNQSQFDKEIDNIQRQRLDQLASVNMQALTFFVDKIKSQYSEELENALPSLNEKTQQMLREFLSGDFNFDTMTNKDFKSMWDWMFKDLKNSDLIDNTTKDALNDLLSALQPSIENMEELKQQYYEQGLELPKSFSEGLQEVTQLQALAEDKNAIWQMIGDEVQDNEYYQKTVNMLYDKGKYVPEAIEEGIIANENRLKIRLDKLFYDFGGYAKNLFYQGIKIDVPILPEFKIPMTNEAYQQQLIGGHATGGIFDKPHIAWFAEAGPEAAIPLDGSKNAINLWEETGRLLGMPEINLNNLQEGVKQSFEQEECKFFYNPIINFYGNAPEKEEIQSALRSEEEHFEQMMNRWMREKGRLQFGG